MRFLARFDYPARKEEAIRTGERDDTSREGYRRRDRHNVAHQGQEMHIEQRHGNSVINLYYRLTAFHRFVLSVIHDTPSHEIHAVFESKASLCRKRHRKVSVAAGGQVSTANKEVVYRGGNPHGTENGNFGRRGAVFS